MIDHLTSITLAPGSELHGLLTRFAQECDRPIEEALATVMLNGMTVCLSQALERGASDNHELLRDVQRTALALVRRAHMRAYLGRVCVPQD